jgi:hypothetical protein
VITPGVPPGAGGVPARMPAAGGHRAPRNC